MTYYLTVDLGTGNTRVALVSSASEILGIRTVTNNYLRDDAYPDAQYFLPDDWAKEIFRCCEELHNEFPHVKVSAISSAGARQSIVLIDKEGRAFYGLPNIDNRGREYMDEITDRDEIYKKSGKWVTEDFPAAKLLGLKRLRPELFERTAKIVSISEWIAYIFTGVASMEPSQACETQLYDLENKCWSEDLCSAYSICPSILPRLIPAGTAVGPVLPELVSLYNMEEDAVFVMGGADTQVALRHSDMQSGDIAIVSGTTSPVVVLSDKKYYDPEQRVWTDADLGGEKFVVEMNPGVTGLNYQRITKALCPDLSYDCLERRYAEKKDFSCTASFSSLLFYEKRSLRNGGFFMRSPLDAAADRVDMCWAVLADIACSTYEQLRRLTALTGSTSRFIWGCGGGFRSEALRGMIADLSGLELRLRSGFEQSTVLGLIRLCNDYMGIEEYRAADEEIICRMPCSGSLIHKYYPIWLANRNKANGQ